MSPEGQFQLLRLLYQFSPPWCPMHHGLSYLYWAASLFSSLSGKPGPLPWPNPTLTSPTRCEDGATASFSACKPLGVLSPKEQRQVSHPRHSVPTERHNVSWPGRGCQSNSLTREQKSGQQNTNLSLQQLVWPFLRIPKKLHQLQSLHPPVWTAHVIQWQGWSEITCPFTVFIKLHHVQTQVTLSSFQGHFVLNCSQWGHQVFSHCTYKSLGLSLLQTAAA